jgi:methionyl-tRNA synthetase
MFKFLKNKKEEEKNTEIKQTEIKNTESKITGEGKIQYDDFAKVEMTVGKIIEAEKVENADRLLKLKVDFGTETRQIISGIAEFYTPEEIIGKKCPFVTNLEPRTIKGFESNGMILAAKDKKGNFSLLNVNDAVEVGTKLS